MHTVIDADIVCFRCAAASENDPEEVAILRCNDLMYRIIQNTDAQTYTAWLSGGENVRKGIDPSYKANREGKVDPRYRETIKAHLIVEWHAKLSDGTEADDELGIEQCSYPFGESTIASIDKDLMQIPGYHYNFVKEEYVTVSPLDGLRSFYRNLLIGDNADNISGIRGIGKVKASRIIDTLDNEMDMFLTVQDMYSDDARLLRNGKLMWLHRKLDDWWRFPEQEIEGTGEVIPIQE